jgi:hypothetical protein
MLPIQGRTYFDEETQGGVCFAVLPWAVGCSPRWGLSLCHTSGIFRIDTISLQIAGLCVSKGAQASRLCGH